MEVEIDDLEDDFQEPLPIVIQINNKRKKLLEIEDNDSSNITEQSTCSLCQNTWSIAGFHRIVSLNCGHLFGKSCIMNHLRFNKKLKKANCPICSKVFIKRDVWPIWPKKMAKADPLHIKQLQDELEELKKKELDQANAIKNVQAEIKLHREELSQLNSSQPLLLATVLPPPPPSSLPTQPLTHPVIRSGFIDWEAIQLSTENTSRVLAFSHSEQDIVFSMNHNGKNGLKKIKIEAPTLSEFIGNHDGLIRDLKCSTYQNMTLSTGSDKTLKLTSMDSNIVVQSYQLESPGWSCSFDSKDPNLLYAGLSNGSLLVFDIRNTTTHLHSLKGIQTNNSPIHAICTNRFIELDSHMTSVICSNLTQCYTWIFNPSNEPELMELHQDITDYRPFSIYCTGNTLMSSFRNKSSTKHIISHFSSTDPKHIETDWTLDLDYPQPILSKNIFFERDHDVICCITNGDKMDLRNKDGTMQHVQMNGNILDVKHHSMNDTELLASLSGSELKIFKYDEY